MKKIDIFFDIKSMGLSFFFPFIVILYIHLLLFFREDVESFIEILSILEFIICPLIAWWTIYLYFDYYEGSAREILFSYPVSKAHHGILRVWTFLLLYSSLIILLFIHINFQFETFMVSTSLVQYLPQILMYSSISFLLVIIFKSIIPPIIIIVGYVISKYFTYGSPALPLYNIMYFNKEVLQLEDIVGKSLLNVLLSCIFYFVGHLIFSNNRYMLK
ncbi:hypothetical protein ACFVAD_07665 [Sutcliffiella sp. NPDC057660]|uniref:hypothetical protein n=1 Tax=Sutcliffiella sp. NPDC057660 TaxID=3346199 RepID=UPI003696C874